PCRYARSEKPRPTIAQATFNGEQAMSQSAPRMATNAQIAEWIEAARNGSREALGQLLEMFRPLLLAIANRELDSGLRTKAGASDLVQDTLLGAQEGFPRFHGATEEELCNWLCGILNHHLANLERRYRTDKRQLSREVPLADLQGGGPSIDRTSPGQTAGF